MVFRNVAMQQRAELLLTDQRKILEQMARAHRSRRCWRRCARQSSGEAVGCIATVLLAEDEGPAAPLCRQAPLSALFHPCCRSGFGWALAGSCGTAAYRGQQVIVADIAHDPLWQNYRELAQQLWLASLLVRADPFFRGACAWHVRPLFHVAPSPDRP